jgi:NAD-dependent SIR2 family protein deacetylase
MVGVELLVHHWRFELMARVNGGHRALSGLARRKKGSVCLTQNIDGEF